MCIFAGKRHKPIVFQVSLSWLCQEMTPLLLLLWAAQVSWIWAGTTVSIHAGQVTVNMHDAERCTTVQYSWCAALSVGGCQGCVWLVPWADLRSLDMVNILFSSPGLNILQNRLTLMRLSGSWWWQAWLWHQSHVLFWFSFISRVLMPKGLTSIKQIRVLHTPYSSVWHGCH